MMTMKASLAVLLVLLASAAGLRLNETKIDYDRELFHDEDDDEADLTVTSTMSEEQQKSNVEAPIEPVAKSDTSDSTLQETPLGVTVADIQLERELHLSSIQEGNEENEEATTTNEDDDANEDHSKDPSAESTNHASDEEAVTINETSTGQEEGHARNEILPRQEIGEEELPLGETNEPVEEQLSLEEINEPVADDKSEIDPTLDNGNHDVDESVSYQATGREAFENDRSIRGDTETTQKSDSIDIEGEPFDGNGNSTPAESTENNAKIGATTGTKNHLGSLAKSFLQKKSVVHADYCSRPPCGFWGDPKREILFANTTVLDRIMNATQEQNRTADASVVDDESEIQEIVKEAAEEIKEALVDELVEGLDDIDKLFEGVTTPDEFDVASNGSTIQEVLMGSATRVIFKRISVGANIARTKTMNLIKKISQKVRKRQQNIETENKGQAEGWPLMNVFRNADGNLAPFRSLRDDTGKFAPLKNLRDSKGGLAPLQSFRNPDGELAPLHRFRNPEGKLTFPSKQRIFITIKSFGRMILSGIKTVEALVDKLLEGDSNEEAYGDAEQIRQHLQKAGVDR